METGIAVIYRELNNHLREVDRKRDQTMDLYVKISLTALSGLVLLQTYKTKLNGEVYFIASFVFAIIFLFGQSIHRQMVSARKWHVEYLNAIMILQYLIVNKESNVKKVFKEIKKKEHHFVKSKYTSRASTLTQYFIIINIITTLYLLFEASKYPIYDFIIICLILIAIDVILNKKYEIKTLSKAENEFWNHPEKVWGLSGVIENTEIKND